MAARLALSEKVIRPAYAPSRPAESCRIAYHGRSRAIVARLVHAMKTYVATPADRERNWLIVDASGQTLGRLATQIADTLRGKRKPTYTPHVDTGDFVIVVNAEKIAVTGNKLAGQALLPPLRVSRRVEVPHAQRHARAPARRGHPPRGQGDAAAQPPRAQAADEAEGLRGSGASARRTAAATDGDRAVTERPEDEQQADDQDARDVPEEPEAQPREPSRAGGRGARRRGAGRRGAGAPTAEEPVAEEPAAAEPGRLRPRSQSPRSPSPSQPPRSRAAERRRARRRGGWSREDDTPDVGRGPAEPDRGR